jgi:hypothetical protein
VHNVEDVLPQVVILGNMSVEATLTVLVKDEPIVVANETEVV